jgi:hypothetical protein
MCSRTDQPARLDVAGAIALALAAAACATTGTVCPEGTRLVGGRPPHARAQWCAARAMTMHAVPVARSYETTLGVAMPTAMAGGVEGPYTSWHDDGALASHGRYVDLGPRSVPDGVWGFWYASGQPRALGAYRQGRPTGCFAVWAEDGTRTTGFTDGQRLIAEPCEPPDAIDRAVAEGAGSSGTIDPSWGDVTLQGFVGHGGLGLRNADQAHPDPRLRAAFSAIARKHVGRFRIGPYGGLRAGDNVEYRVLATGIVAGVALPRPHPRVDAEVSLDLGAQHLRATALRAQRLGTARVDAWAPLAGAQLAAAIAMSPILELVGAVRVDGAPTRDVERELVYCDRVCEAPVRETWRVGGVAFGITLGLRLQIR